MLEDLDQIDWHTLTHAYGEADDVPVLLRDLASQDEETRRAALGTLYTNIYHQGTVYQASAYAVPFLIELLENETVPERHELMNLLAHLARGDAYHRQHWRYYSEARRKEPGFQRELAKQVSWVNRTHEVVREGLPVYVSLLAHPDRQLSMSAAYLLAHLPERRQDILPILVTTLQQAEDQCIRASLLLSLGKLAGDETEVSRLLEDTLRSELSALLQFAAALALVRRGSPATPQRAVEVLLEAIVRPAPIADLYAELPWAEMLVVFDAIRALCFLSADTASLAVARLLEVIETLGEYEAHEAARTVIYLAFRRTTVRENATVEDLTDEQRAILTVLVQTDIVWPAGAGGGSTTNRPIETRADGATLFEVLVEPYLWDLQPLGLPQRRRELRAFLRLPLAEGDIKRFVTAKSLSFDEFRVLNPQLARKEAEQFWNSTQSLVTTWERRT